MTGSENPYGQPPGSESAADADAAAAAERRAARARRRRQPVRRGRLANAPVTIRYGVPLIAVGVVLYLLLTGRSAHALLDLQDGEGAPIAAGKLEFFEYDDSGAALSPSRRTGERAFSAADILSFDDSLVPGQTLVRIRAEGYGLGFGLLRAGKALRVVMEPAVRVAATVLEPGGKAAVGARVQAFGGGAKGVLLEEAVTDAAGSFEFRCISGYHKSIHIRIRHEGFELLGEDVYADASNNLLVGNGDLAGSGKFVLARTEPVVGHVGLPGALAPAGLLVHVFNKPGLSTEITSEGAFYLDHAPPRQRLRLLIGNLPEGYTHPRTIVSAADREVHVVVRPASVVRGQVFAENTGAGGATVRHEHGPNGREVVACDENGRFVLQRVPPGRIRLFAEYTNREGGRIVARRGSLELQVPKGEAVRDVDITVQKVKPR